MEKLSFFQWLWGYSCPITWRKKSFVSAPSAVDTWVI